MELMPGFDSARAIFCTIAWAATLLAALMFVISFFTDFDGGDADAAGGDGADTGMFSFRAVVGFFLAPTIVTLFRDDPAVIEIGTTVFRWQCLVMPTFSVAVFSNMFFQAVGKSWRATILAISRPGFLIPLSFLLTRFFGLQGLEVTQPLADFFSFLIGSAIMVHYFKCEFGKE
jgi:Na+-driven multidrug efflux pump